MIRGRPWLTKYMPRCRNARRKTPVVEDEPNFYAMGSVHPLKDGAWATVPLPAAVAPSVIAPAPKKLCVEAPLRMVSLPASLPNLTVLQNRNLPHHAVLPGTFIDVLPAPHLRQNLVDEVLTQEILRRRVVRQQETLALLELLRRQQLDSRK